MILNLMGINSKNISKIQRPKEAAFRSKLLKQVKNLLLTPTLTVRNMSKILKLLKAYKLKFKT